MRVDDIPLDQLRGASWNPNVLDEAMQTRLRESLVRYGVVEPLVVRPRGAGTYEVLSGNQRLRVLRELGMDTGPCVVVDLDDAHARLLSQALNRLRGEDDLGLRAELIRQVLEKLPATEVTTVLPETSDSLATLASLGQEDLAAHLQAWQAAQAARLRHLQFQLTAAQLGVVEEALEQARAGCAKEEGNPNRRSTALTAICRAYLAKTEAGE